MDLILHKSRFEYDYEPKRFNLGDRGYWPDFVVKDSVVVEVKGYARERGIEIANDFIESFHEMKYVVVGDEMPCDTHIPWERRSELPELI